MRSFMLSSLVVGLLAAPALADVIRVPQDFATIQQGVDAASNGDTILIGGGTYNENVVINGKNNLLVRGKGTTVLAPAGGIGLYVQNASGVRLQKLTVNGPTFGIALVNAPNSRVERCRATGPVPYLANASNGSQFIRCQATTEGVAMALAGAANYRVERLRASASAAGQAIVATCNRVELERCSVVFTGAPTDAPFELKVAQSAEVVRCKVFAPVGGGLVYGFFADPSNPSAPHLFEGNRIEGMGGGIGAPDGKITARGNRITGARVGIALAADDHLVEDNKLLLGDPAAIGIYLAGSDDCVVRRNKVSGAGTGVFIAAGDDNVVRDNKLKRLNFGVSLTGNSNRIGPNNKFKAILTQNINDGGVGTIIL